MTDKPRQEISTTQGGNKPPQGVIRRRITRKTGAALDLIATRGMSVTDAAAIVGMNRSALSRALNQPHVAEELEARKARYLQVMTATRGTLKARALEVARELMEGAASEAVRMRAVEFLAGESKPSASVSVTVNNSPGYEYVPPGARVVTIEGSANPADE